MKSQLQSLLRVCAGIVILLCTGCASTGDALIPGANYDRTAITLRTAVASGNVQQLQREANRLERRARGGDRILYLQEQGRLLSLAGDLPGSIRVLQEASDQFEWERMRPELAISNVFFSASSLALNDLAIPYRGFSHEKVMVHNLLAMNYLRTGNLDFARIELNRADLEQLFALEQNQRLAQRAEQQAAQQGIGLQQAQASFDRVLIGARGSSDVRNSFQNAFTFALSGILFELTGSLDRAVIDYRRALAIQPGNTHLQRLEASASDRLAGGLGQPPNLSSRVVLIYESGLVQTREEFRIPFIWNGELLQIAVPFMGGQQSPLRHMTISGGGIDTERFSVSSEVLADIDAMAAHALREKMPAIFVRQVMRSIVRYQTQREAGARDPLAGFLVTLFNVLTDKADLRAWSTLPSTHQIGVLDLPPGEHTLQLQQGNFSLDLPVSLHRDSIHFIFLSRAGDAYFLDTAHFLRPQQPTS